MPTYEYKCADCEHQMEVFARMSDPPPEACEACGGTTLSKVLFPVAVHYKGSGFYSTDYAGRRSDSGSGGDTAGADSGSGSGSSDGGAGSADAGSGGSASSGADSGSGTSSSSSGDASGGSSSGSSGDSSSGSSDA